MLTVIKKGTLVPTLEKVVALDANNNALVGYLTESTETNQWICNDTKQVLLNVVKFIRLNNLAVL